MRKALWVSRSSQLARRRRLPAGMLRGTRRRDVPTARSADGQDHRHRDRSSSSCSRSSTSRRRQTVIFKVVNKGKIAHDFKIAGKKTKMLNPGKSQTITVKFKKKGHFAYLCTVSGHAKLGMKGTFGVGVKAAEADDDRRRRPRRPRRADDDDADAAPSARQHDGQGRDVRVPVRPLAEDGAVGPGHVRDHEQGQRGRTTSRSPASRPARSSGRAQTETWTVALPAGSYTYVCDVPFHVDRGMTGALTVTP